MYTHYLFCVGQLLLGISIWVFCIFVHNMCIWCLWRLEDDVGCSRLELQTVVICHIDAENQTCVLWQSIQCS